MLYFAFTPPMDCMMKMGQLNSAPTPWFHQVKICSHPCFLAAAGVSASESQFQTMLKQMNLLSL
jgi:hypothetical protein